MKSIITQLGSFMLAIQLLVACSKSNDSAPTTATLEGTYRYVKATARINNQEIDLNNQQPPCALDDLVEFASPGIYRQKEGNNVCVPSNAGTGTYTRNGNTIQVSIGSGSVTLTIISLTATELILEGYSDRFQQDIRIYSARL